MTVRLLPGEKRIRFPLLLGFRPSPSSMIPALTSSSLNFPMAVRSSLLGIFPASEFFVAFTITITRIAVLPVGSRGRAGHDRPGSPASDLATNRGGADRHVRRPDTKALRIQALDGERASKVSGTFGRLRSPYQRPGMSAGVRRAHACHVS